MSESLRAVWQEIEHLLDYGINLIPVRDKDTIYKGKLYEAKTPYAEWKQYQYELIDRAVLFDQMANRYDTTAVAMVCGSISGNLEVIDFDTKYYPGIDAVVLTALRELYPDIFAKLKRHRTRSGGVHLVYRIADHDVPASAHLAERPATQEELDADTAKNKRKSRCFIETRGTGGLATAPPSLGYTALNAIDIQTITWEERCTIVEFCKSYNEYFPNEKPYTPPKSEQNYYDENPFEHYNRTVDPVELLTSFGWTYVRKHGDYIWFTRPGGRRGDVHAGFNTNTNTYRVWGTKSDLDSERSYTPSTILAHYQFNDDKSTTYAHLVQQGYGRIKPHVEQQIARRKATQGVPMPTNASAQAVEQYNTIVTETLEQFPHGIYWEEDDDGTIVISRYKWNNVASNLGFRLHEGQLVQIVEQFIHRRDIDFFYNTMRDYIHHDNPNIYEEIYNSFQAFIEKHGKFESTRLDPLATENILQDTRTACYKFYANGYVHIHTAGYNLLPYNELNGKLIWNEKIQIRDFVFLDQYAGNTTSTLHNTSAKATTGLYTDFLQRACSLADVRNHIQKVVGWLAHDYKDASMAYIVVLVEQCVDPRDGGGSGKNLFCELLKHTTTYGSMAAGQKRNFDGTNLLQAWNGEKIYALSDVKKDFDYEMLKEPAGGKAIVKKLFKDEKNIAIDQVPKFIVLTNFSYEVTDGGLRRRIIPIEFTNFFTECGGVDKHYGKMFPDDWGADDWADYDNFICQSVVAWLQGGLKLTPKQLTGSGWQKQFAQTYGRYTHDFIDHHWHTWVGTFVSNAEFKKQMDDYFTDLGMGPFDKFRPKMHTVNKAIEEWAKHHKVRYVKDAQKRIDAFTKERGREFALEDAPF